MCSCFQSSSVVDTGFSRNQEPKEETVSFSVSKHLKDITVRIVHAGGRIEMYQNPIPASKLLQRYPGMCIARPEIFKRPHESLLSANDTLLPGNIYFIIRSSTVEKLKRNHPENERMKVPADHNSDEPILTSEEIEDVGNNCCEESFSSAKDFFVSKDRWSSYELKKRRKEKKRFVPPIQRPRIRKEPEWEPSLTSIQEVSP